MSLWLGETLVQYMECMGPAISRNSGCAISWPTVSCREHAQEPGKQHLRYSLASLKCVSLMLGRRIASVFEAIMLQVAVELGGYIGYSAVRIASQLPPGGKLYSIDPNENHVRIARALIQHAGLSDKVEVIQGILETSIQVHALVS